MVMTIFLWIVFATTLCLLLAVASVRPRQPQMSRFEVVRLAGLDNETAKQDARRIDSFEAILTLQRVVCTILLIIVILMSVGLLGWFIGVVVAAVIALEYPTVARLPLMSRMVQRYYDHLEDRILRVTQTLKGPLALFKAHPQTLDPPLISSREELENSIATMTGGITQEEKNQLTHNLTFGSRLVSEVMTPRSAIDTVESSELLGPLALDELHKTGHSRFPVVEGDIDHVVGILYIQDLLTIKQQKSPTARDAMVSKVFYIREDQTLQHALNAFIRTHHHLFIVVNEYRETVGVVSLEDVMEALLGRKIVDEFDAHDNLRMVAERNPRGNNVPKSHTDV